MARYDQSDSPIACNPGASDIAIPQTRPLAPTDIEVIDLTVSPAPQDTLPDLPATCTADDSTFAIGSLAPAIRKFLGESRVGSIGEAELARTAYVLAADEVHPADLRKTSRPQSFYRAILASRNALDLSASDMQRIEVAPIDVSDLGLETLKLVPRDPIVIDTQFATPESRDIIPRIYQALLGKTAVHQTDGRWNIATPSGVIDMQARTGVGNPMFAMFCTEDMTFICFAQEIDPHAVSATPMHIHTAMKGASRIVDGDLTVIDARRFIHKTEDTSAPRSAFASREGELATILSSKPTAEQAIANAMRQALPAGAIVTRIHVNRVADEEKCLTDALKAIRKATKHAIDYVYLRDVGIKVANNPIPTIWRLQKFACVVNQLRDQRYVGNMASMAITACRLFDPDIVKALTSGLGNLHCDSPFTRKVSIRSCTGYFQLIAALMFDDMMSASTVVDGLKSEAGQCLVSELGRHVGHREAMSRAFMSVLDQMLTANVALASIKSVLIPDQALKLTGFLSEIRTSIKQGAPHAEAFQCELIDKSYAVKSTFGHVTKAYLSIAHARDFAILQPGTRSRGALISNAQRASNDVVAHRPIETILDILREDLSMETFVTMAKNNLEHDLMEVMPTVTVGEQRSFRGTMTEVANDAWREKLPGQTAPSRVVRSLIEGFQPQFMRKLTDARKQSRDAIIGTALETYATSIRSHPDATKDQLSAAREAAWHTAMASFFSLVSADHDEASTSARALAASGSEKASASAQEIKTASVSAATALASASSTRVQREAQSHSQHVQMAAAAARTQTKQAIAESTQKTIRELGATVTRIVSESAAKKSEREAKARADRVAKAQATNAARTYTSDVQREAEARAKRLVSAHNARNFTFSSSYSLVSVAPSARSGDSFSRDLAALAQIRVPSASIRSASIASSGVGSAASTPQASATSTPRSRSRAASRQAESP